MAKSVLKYRNMTVDRVAGEQARFRVLGGPDSGVLFVLTANKASLGRGEENDIILTDLKISRKHLEILVMAGQVTVRDLGSAHGIAVNGKIERSATLRSGDKIGVGSSVLEFISADQGNTKVLSTQPSQMSGSVGSGFSGLTQFINRAALSSGNSPKITETFLDKNKKFLTVLAALMVIAALLPEVERKQRQKKNSYLDPREVELTRGPSSLVPPQIQSDIINRSNNQFREGFREFREKNYLRAIAMFETALQIYPNHALAKVYLETTRKKMEDEANDLVKYAKRDEEANRLNQALLKYESIKRLYIKDQSNPLFKEAESRVIDLGRRIKGQDLEE